MKRPVDSIKENLREHADSSYHSLVSWKSIFGGIFVTLLVYALLTALGAGIGGASMANSFQMGRDGGGLATGAVIWTAISILLALVVGSYFAARTSTFITGRIGAAQGLVIAALFFGFMLYGMSQTVGALGKGLGDLVSMAGVSSANFAANLASNPVVLDTVEKDIGDIKLKSETSEVAVGLATRLIHGETNSAKNYLIYQTGLSPAEVNAKFDQLQTAIDEQVTRISTKTADMISAAGWSLFAILIVGVVSAALGGALGSRVNYHTPLSDEREVIGLDERAIVQ